MSDEQLELWELPEDRPGDSPMVASVKSSLRTLREADKLPPERAALGQLCLELADAISKGARTGRASAVAMAAAQLRDTMLVIDPPAEDGDASADAMRLLSEFMARLDAAADAGVTALPRAVS